MKPVAAGRANQSAGHCCASLRGVQFCGLIPIGVLAIIFGHKARHQIQQAGGGGVGMATAGLVLGYIGTAVFLLGIALQFVLTHQIVPGVAR